MFLSNTVSKHIQFIFRINTYMHMKYCGLYYSCKTLTNYRQTPDIQRTKSQNTNVSRLVLQLS